MSNSKAIFELSTGALREALGLPNWVTVRDAAKIIGHDTITFEIEVPEGSIPDVDTGGTYWYLTARVMKPGETVLYGFTGPIVPATQPTQSSSELLEASAEAPISRLGTALL